ncbi:MAG: hypothetical protein K2P83_02430 [Nitrosomonas sp.]|nr:hypothetical protein [Nitrosomonas sp.]
MAILVIKTDLRAEKVCIYTMPLEHRTPVSQSEAGGDINKLVAAETQYAGVWIQIR